MSNSGDGMRVMLLASGDLWSGAEVMLYQLAYCLQKNDKVEILVVLLNNGQLAEELKHISVRVCIIDEAYLSILNLVKEIHKIVKEFSPHSIHSHRYKENFLASLACIGKSKTQLVATQHGMPEISIEAYNIKNWLRTNFFFRLLSICFDKTVVVSEEMYQILQGSYGFSDKNMTIIHNGIEISRDIKKQANQRLIIGSAGRLFPVKDYSRLVDIAAQLVIQNDTVTFVLAGDGPQRTELEQKVKNYGIEDRFLFLGHQNDMAGFYKSLDVYINTSVHEGIPMSVLEAMSYELPVVAPDVGGFPEILHNNINGFLVEKRNKDIYVDCLLQLIQNKSLRLTMAKAARKSVIEQFSRDVMAEKYYNLYRKLILN